MHVGAVVVDLDAAMAEHGRCGAGPWVTTPAHTFTTFDGERETVVDQDVRVAFGALPGGAALELVEPQASTPACPQARLLAAGTGVTHMAYWCRDVATHGAAILDRGGRVFSVSLPGDAPWEEALATDGPRGVLALGATAYLRLATGALVELVSPAVLPGLRSTFGARIDDVLPAPAVA